MPTPAQQIITPEDRFAAAFEANEGHVLNGSNNRLRELRKDAIEHFRLLGLPAPKSEAWKYTNIEKVLRHEYEIELGRPEHGLTSGDLGPFLIPDLDVHLFVLINGRPEAELSRLGDVPEGVVVMGLGEAAQKHADLVNQHLAQYASYKDEPLRALNTAFIHDGVFVYVPKGKVVEKPIHVLSLVKTDQDLFLQPRTLVIAEEHADVKLIETNHTLSETKTFTNALDEFFVAERAHVDHYRVQDEGPHASQVLTLQAYQLGESTFRTSTITLSGEVVRNNLSFLPDAEHCESHLFGLVLANGAMHVDNHTFVDHAKPNCFSNELYKNVLNDEATGVFNGKVFVRQDAQKTNAYQSNKSLILSEAAKMYAKPELEIYADDVQCSHGATTGQIDPEALFYLRSRGIGERQARAMLLLAFARDVLDNIRIAPLRAMLDEQVQERFHA